MEKTTASKKEEMLNNEICFHQQAIDECLKEVKSIKNVIKWHSEKISDVENTLHSLKED